MIPVDFTGTLPGWITAGAVISIFGMMLRNQVHNRKLGIERFSAENVAAGAIGELYAEEVKALRTRLDDHSRMAKEALADMEARYKALLEESNHRHDECERERVKLHSEVAVLRKEIDGLVRVITQASIDRVIMLGDDVPEDIRSAAFRAQQFITAERENNDGS